MAQTTPSADIAERPADIMNVTARHHGFVRTAFAWSPAVAAVALMAFAVGTGLPVSHAITATLAVLITQVLPGAVAWRAVRPRKGWLVEDLAMGFAIGSVLAIGAQVVAGLTDQPWIAFSPVLVAVVLMTVPATRASVMSAETRSLPQWWGPPIAALFLLTVPQLRAYFRLVPLAWESGARAIHVDAYLHLALASQLAHRGPTRFPWVESEALGYHWFSHAWVAQVSATSGAGLDEVLFRFMPALMPVVVLSSVAIAAVRLTNRYWTGSVAGVLALIGGDLNVFGKLSPGSPITPLSPSLGLAGPMLVGIVTLLALRWNRAMRPWGLVLLPIVCIGAAGTKGSTVPLILAGLGLAVAAMLVFDRTRVWQVAAEFALVAGCLAFAMVFVFRGSSAGLHISPSDAALQTWSGAWLGAPEDAYQFVLVMALSFVAVTARGVGVFVLPFSRAGRRDPLSWLLIGAAVAAGGAIAALAHPGASQVYFARSAEPLLALGSVLGLVALMSAIDPARRGRIVALGLAMGPFMAFLGPLVVGPSVHGDWPRALALVAVAALVLATSGVVGGLAGASRAQRLRIAGAAMLITILSAGVATAARALVAPSHWSAAVVSITSDRATSRDQVDAARWIRDHSDVHDLVMTNRHCTTPVEPITCDSRRFVVAAFSERQVLLEGWTATPMSAELGPNGRDSITVGYWKPELLRLNDDFIARPTEDAARQLRDLGVRWIYVDHTRPYASSLEPFATLRYQTPGVDVYEFTGTA